jgi:uncharacterized membrane protein HdeD (DUF308 family)
MEADMKLLYAVWAFYFIVAWVVNIVFCIWIAQQKNRSQVSWGILSAIFPVLAAIWLAGTPKVEKQP